MCSEHHLNITRLTVPDFMHTESMKALSVSINRRFSITDHFCILLVDNLKQSTSHFIEL